MGPDSVRMVAIEADWTPGYPYFEDYVQGTYSRQEQAGTTNAILTDYYDMTDNTKKPQENTAYYIALQASLNDDRYQLGGIKSINARTLSVRTASGTTWMRTVNAIGGALSHMDWTIAQRTH